MKKLDLRPDPLSDEQIKKRYKMYKCKKHWVYSAILFLGTGAAITVSGVTAQAEESTTPTTPTTTTGATSTTPDSSISTAPSSAAMVTTPTAAEKAVAVATVENATIKFVDAAGNEIANKKMISGDSNAVISPTLFQDDYQAVIDRGYTVVTDETRNAAFDDDATVDQEFTIHFEKVVAPVASSTASAPAEAGTSESAASSTTSSPAATTPSSVEENTVPSTTATTSSSVEKDTATSTSTVAPEQSATSTTSTDKTKDAANSATKKAAEPKIMYKNAPAPVGTPATSQGTVTLDVDGKTDKVVDKYDTTNNVAVTDGTPAARNINITVGNLKKNDVVTITVPDFKSISHYDTVTNTTPVQKGNVVTYTILADNFSGTFAVQIKDVGATNQPDAVGKIVAQLNGNDVNSIDLESIYKTGNLSAQMVPMSNGSSGATTTIPVNENFASSFGGYNVDALYSKVSLDKVNGLVYTIPVPTDYVLDVAASEAFQTAKWGVNFFTYSQTAKGSDVVITLDKVKAANASKKTLDNIRGYSFFVGKIVTGSGTLAATNAGTTTLKSSFGDATVALTKFSVNLAGVVTVKVTTPTMPIIYVSKDDVGKYDVNTGNEISISTGKPASEKIVATLTIPTGMTSKAITVSDTAKLLYSGLKGTVEALAADGSTLSSITLEKLLTGKTGAVIWTPEITGTISKYRVSTTTMPNGTFGSLALEPKLTVDVLPTTVTQVVIPTAITSGGVDQQFTGYGLNLSPNHIIYQYPYYSPVNGTTGVKNPGDDITFSVYPFGRSDQTAYAILDNPATVYVQLPSNTTFKSINKLATNTTVITDSTGKQFLKIIIPAGYNTYQSRNTSYNTSVNATTFSVTATVNSDVTKDSFIGYSKDLNTNLPVWVAVKNQMDDNTWKSTNDGTIKTLADAIAYSDVLGNDAKQAGYDKLYGSKPSTLVWTASVPKVFYLADGIKAKGDPGYVSGDTLFATFYPADNKTTGEIRSYAFNGETGEIINYYDVITLPKKADGAAYSLNLTGAVTPAATSTVKYSTNIYTLKDGEKLTDAQLAEFVEASAITDWTTVKSVLVNAPSLPTGTTIQNLLPIAIADVDMANANTAKVAATSYSYAAEKVGGKVLGASTKLLNTNLKVKRSVTVKYVDTKGSVLFPDQVVSGNEGATLTLNALTIAGYELKDPNVTAGATSKTYTLTNAADQSVTFVYDKTTMKVTVNLIDSRTNKNIGSAISLTGKIDDVLPLTDAKYTTQAGYTVNSTNTTSYKVTNAAAQVVNLYFTPIQHMVTIYYLAAADRTHVLAPATTQTGYPGDALAITPPTVIWYTPQAAVTNYTMTALDGSVDILYDGLPQTITVKYVDADDSTRELAPAGTLTTKSNAGYDLAKSGLVPSIAGNYQLTPESVTAEKGIATIDAKTGALLVNTITLKYQKTYDLNVKYVLDEDPTVEISDAKVLGVKAGSTYDLQVANLVKTIPGYTLAPASVALEKGTATVNKTTNTLDKDTVVLAYQKNYQIQVKYVDFDNPADPVADSKTIDVIGGQAYDLNNLGLVPTVAGYTLRAENTALATGTAAVNTTEHKLVTPVITLTYQKDYSLNVKYVFDEDPTVELSDAKTLAIKAGDTYDLATANLVKTISGYTLAPSSIALEKGTATVDATTNKLSNGTNGTIVLAYQKNYQVEVQYVDYQQGTEIAESKLRALLLMVKHMI